jgi:hypothetical protein
MTSDVKNMFDKERINQDLAEKLRKDHPLQLSTLIRMHLSFLLDLNCLNEDNEVESTDKTKSKKNWLFHKKKASSVCTSNPHSKSPEIPIFLPEMMKQLMTLIDFLQKDENLKQEGIFRKTGSITRQQDLKFLVNQLRPLMIDDTEYTAHDVASVLKSILNDLPEPILVEAYFPAYSQIADICNSKENDEHERIQNSLQLLFLLLPIENRNILEKLIVLLHKASTLEAFNKMNSDSLATLFTPHLVVPRKLSPEVLHQTAANMTKMISFIITNGSKIFLVPEKLATDIKAYLIEEKRRKETPERILDESVSDSVANTVFTFIDREKTAEAHGQSTTDTALAQLYAHIQSLPESSKKKKLIKQFNKQNGQGTPLQYVNRDKSVSTCRSIGDSIKKHIFHKTLNKTPKCSTNTPSSSKITRTPSVQTYPNKRILFQSPLPASKPSPIMELKSSSDIHNQSMSNSSTSSTSSNNEMSPMKTLSKQTSDNENNPVVPVDDNQLEMSNEMIDDEDFVDSSDEEDENLQKTLINRNILLPIDEMEHKSLISGGSERKKATSIFKSRLMKGVSLGNLKFPFHSSTATPKTSPKLKKSKSSSILIDIEKEKLLMKSATESFNSSEESDMYFSMDHTKESWHVDVSNINYFLNQTGMQDHQGGVRNSMSPITKSTQRMPKSMQESIMTPRSRKPVMLSLFGNSERQTNISQLLEESEEVIQENEELSSQAVPIKMLSKNNQDISNASLNAANDNGLPTIPEHGSSNSSGSLSSAFKDYMYSRGHQIYDNDQDDYSFSSQSDDFESSNEYQKLEESHEEVKDKNESTNTTQEIDIDKIMNQSSSMSKSLLHCLDGNETSLLSPQSSFEKNRKRQLDNDSLRESSTESLKRPLIDKDLTDF